jgi:predicted transposase YbfD/YdcC
MAIGFGEVSPEEKKAIVTAKRPIATIDEIQKSLSGYFAEIKDPRVARTQKHLLNEILTDIVRQIRDKKADYVLTLKANHPTLYHQVKNWFVQAQNNQFEGIDVSYDQRLDKGHHRVEKRQVWAVPVSAFGGLYQQEQWLGLQTVVMVERVRHLWNKTTREVHFYLSSLPADAQHLGGVIRQHWSIENQVHWTLDVTFKEDQCRIRFGHSPRNFSFLRRMALNILNQEKTFKGSLRQKSKRASMSDDYMVTVLNSFCQA